MIGDFVKRPVDAVNEGLTAAGFLFARARGAVARATSRVREGLRIAHRAELALHRETLAARAKARGDERSADASSITETRGTKKRGWFLRLSGFVFLMGTAFSAHALNCSEAPYFGVIDGYVHPIPPSQIQIDMNCTIRNFPASNPLTTNFSFYTVPGQTDIRYLVVFDNVVHTGNMSCNATHQHKIWFTNGSSTKIQEGCQNLLIPVEKIDKQSPGPTAAIGVPFTYRLTIPVLYDPATGTVIRSNGSLNDLHTVFIRDDLNATGVDLTIVGTPTVTWLDTGDPVPHTYNGGVGNVLEFNIGPIIPRDQQIVIDITVVLDDSPVNIPGRQFINTATWSFGRAIDVNGNGVLEPDEFFSPLPGENGISQPMTIAAPNLVVTKSSTETALNLGFFAPFTIDVQNTGGANAWEVTILDRLPSFSGGAGMCQFDPRPTLSARIVAADGTTLVRNLAAGTDYALSYTGEPTCELRLTMTPAGGPIAPNQHLVITYQTQLDPNTTAEGAPLTNVAGAVQWFSSDGSSPAPRTAFNRTLTNGTPGILDHEASYTITTGLSGYYFQKTVANRTSNVSQASTAAAGDILRYRLRLFNLDQVINGITITDTLDGTRFDLSSFTMVTPPPAGATYSYNPATGLLVVTGSPDPLNLAPPAELVVEFDITLLPTLTNGMQVSNQAHLDATSGIQADSDDPYVNGVAPPGEPADPTVITIVAPGPLLKATTRSTATIGERFTYRITVPETPIDLPLYDVQIRDDLTASAADLRFVSANVVSGGTWTLTNIGTPTVPIVADTITGIDIPPNGQAVVEITVELLNTLDNNAGLSFGNTATYTYNRSNGDAGTQRTGGAGGSGSMTVVEPAVTTATKTVSNVTAGKQPGDPADVNDVLEYVVTVPNSGTSTAYDMSVIDTLAPNVSLIAGSASARINGVLVAGFVPDPTPIPGRTVVWGARNGDDSLDVPAGQSLVLTYRVTVGSVNGTPINNTAYIDWTSLNGPFPTDPSPGRERTGEDCPSITAPNDYCYGPITTAQATVDTTTLVKSVVSDSWDSGLSTATDARLRIGDTVVYRLALRLREGQLQNVVVTDTLPTGLVFDGVVSINGDTTAPFSAVAPFAHADFTAPTVSGATVTWNLGDIANAIDHDAANDTFVIEYRARVLKDTLTHVASTALANNAVLSYTGSEPGAARLQSGASVTVLQPIMTTPTKSAAGYTSPTLVNVASDVMPFHLESCNTNGLAPAYSVRITDQLPTQMNETTITTPVVAVGGAQLTAGSDYTYTPPAARGGTMVFVLNTPVNPGQCVTIDFSIGFHTDFGPNQVWNNEATLDEYWSLQTPTTTGQRYGPLGPALFTMQNNAPIWAPIKTLTSPAGGQATIGEEVVYRIAVPGTVTNAAIFDVVITDTLHPALEYLGATEVSGNNFAIVDNSVAPGQVSLTIAQIPAGQQAIIELRTRVANNASANAGVSFANTASYTYATAPGGPANPGGSDATDTPLTIIEPSVGVTKSVAPNTPPAAGDILTYTLTIAAAGGGAGDIYSSAYEVSIVDALSPGLVYVPNTATVGGTPVNPTTNGGDGVSTPQVLTWNTGLDIPEGTAVVVTYQVRVVASVGAGQNLRNDVRVEWTGLDGVNPNERVGTGAPAYNDYFATASTTLTTPLPGALGKQNPTPATAAIGAPFTYRITVPAAPATTALYDVQIVDTLPAGVQFLSVTKVSSGGTWTPVASVSGSTLTITGTDTGIDIPAGEQAIVDVTVALIDDTAVNFTGRTFTNTATYTYNRANATGPPATTPNVTTPPMTVVGADQLTFDKSGPAQMRPGVPGTFTLNVHNVGSGTAWGLTITDRLPNPAPGGMCDTAPTNVTARLYLADGVTPAGSPLVAGTDFAANFDGVPGCTFTITLQSAAAAIPANQRLIVTYQALLDADNVNGALLTNVAGATQWYGANPAGGGTPHIYNRVLTDGTVGTLDHQDAHTVAIETPVLVFRKTVANVTLPGPTARPGDVLRYTLRIENVSPVPVTSFTLTDVLDRLNTPALFQPGTLSLVTVPAGANASNTSATGGPQGTGLVDIRNLTLAASDGAPGGADELTVVYEVALTSPIDNGTIVRNQAQLTGIALVPINSDDPNVNGADDPNVFGDEDPTRITVVSAPAFRVQKTSTDLTGDPNVLMAGDQLRYTITVKNIGSENAVNVTLRDQLPANTTYVAGSTTLNGAAVADVGGVSPLQAGMLIHAPEDPTPGALRADATSTTANVATVTFTVVVNADVVDGTIISNQAFVTGAGANSGAFPEKPSDDPATPTPDDPTRDIVGNLPLVYAVKTVAIVVDNGSPGIVDPGDVLRYTISVTNSAATPATGVVLSDPVPANTTYVADSVRLNGLPVGQPDGGTSPLVGGIPISSSDLTPPLPPAGGGTLSAGGTATVTFDVQVNPGVPTGTIISNQGSIATNQLPPQLTDADGVPSNGQQPTDVVVGDSQLLRITKEVFVVGGGVAQAGGQLEYVVRVTNIGAVPATNVVITDDLSPIGPDPYVPGSGTLNGLSAGIGYAAPVLTANYASVYGDLAPGAGTVLRFRVNIPAGVAIGTTIANTAVVSWNTPAQSTSGSVSVNVGGVPGSAILGGRVWHDPNYNDTYDSGERVLAGWTVELYRNGAPLASGATDADGTYRFSGLAPNDTTTDRYEVRFRAPGAGPNTAMLGRADSPFTNGMQRITDIVAGSGSNHADLNLPIDPNGVVYDSVARTPIAGATLTLLRAATRAPLPGSCFDDPVQQGQVTTTSGYYKFDLNFSDPACPTGVDYLIEVTAPASYGASPSVLIPPVSSDATAPYSLASCSDDAVPATTHCEAQASELPPAPAVAPRSPGTRYYLHLTLSSAQMPEESQLFNNHLPIDPELEAAIMITKTTPLVNVTRAQLVPYTITIRNTLGGALQELAVVDLAPPGFKYVQGSSRFDGRAVEPVSNGREIRWEGLELVPGETHTIKLLMVVGAGVAEGEYVNRAQMTSAMTGGAVSGVATATVRVVPDPTFDCTDIIGKVYDDANLDGYQDENEKGLAGVRVVSARGLIAKTDEHGRFHITCAAIPNADRGSNFILKVDDRSLPAGYRLTTENPLVLRATRGKAIKFNFGAALHRVVRLDIADGVFEPGTTEVRPQWASRIGLLLEELRKAPSILRISYLGDVEDAALAKARLEAIKQEAARRWTELDCCYRLSIETEIYWRRGGPPDRKALPSDG